MSTTIKASDINSVTSGIVADLLKSIVKKHVDIKDGDHKSGDTKDADTKSADTKSADTKSADTKSADTKASGSGDEYVTKDDLAKFGTDLVKSVTDMLKSGDTKSGDTKSADTKSADTKSADTKDADTKDGDTKSADTKDVDTKSGDTKAIDTKEIVKAILEGINAKGNTARKSYIINGKGSLVKSATDETKSINVDEMSDEEFAELPKATRQKILADEFRNR